MIKIKLVALLIAIFAAERSSALFEIFRWKQIEYEDVPVPTGALVTDYVAYNNVPFGVSRFGSRYFVTVPRRRLGIPYTLNVIDTQNFQKSHIEYNKSPKLKAYPDQITNTPQIPLQADSDRIISVYRTRIDICGRLWFVDTGLLEYPNNQTQVQPPSIWIINLHTNERVQRFEFPEAMRARPDGLMGITVDVERTNCGNAYAYFPNMRTFNIHVYSLRENRAWTTRHNYYFPEPQSGDFNVGGYKFQWSDGIFSIALGPQITPGNRWAYFHSMASLSDYRVPTSVLKNEALATRSYHNDDFQYLGSRMRGLQSNLHDIDVNTGVMYYALAQYNGIGCWNINTPYLPMSHSIIYQNNATMIYPSDMKLDLEGNILAFANKMPIFFYGNLDVNDYNFRIWQGRAPRSCNSRLKGRFGEEGEEEDVENNDM